MKHKGCETSHSAKETATPKPPDKKPEEGGGGSWSPPDMSACMPKLPQMPNVHDMSQLYSKCASDALIKTGGGMGLGIIFSILFFKGRFWPIALLTGFGAGAAFRNCNSDIARKK